MTFEPHEERPSFGARHPLLEIILGNGFLMSGLYLSLGLVIEILRRLTDEPHIAAFARRLDDLPGTVLRLLGILPLLTQAYMDDALSKWSLRLIFGATTIVIIFALAFTTGGVLALVRFFMLRQKNHVAR